jgi:hypothetical protein
MKIHTLTSASLELTPPPHSTPASNNTMSNLPYMNSRSPPPLHHPKPTHPAYPPPEPPKTPGASTNSSPYSQAQRISQDGYMRYSSPPVSETGANIGMGGASSGVGGAMGLNAYGGGAQNIHTRQGFVASPNPAVGQGVGGYGPPPGVGGVNGYGDWGGMNDATAQMGVQFGKSAVAAGQDYVEKNVSGWILDSEEYWLNTRQFTRYLPLTLIKTSFSVTNSYVLHKLRLVLFPWRHKPWARQVRRSGEGGVEGWQAPRDDINAPDLYIPSERGSTSLCLVDIRSHRNSNGNGHVYTPLRPCFRSAISFSPRSTRCLVQ